MMVKDIVPLVARPLRRDGRPMIPQLAASVEVALARIDTGRAEVPAKPARPAPIRLTQPVQLSLPIKAAAAGVSPTAPAAPNVGDDDYDWLFKMSAAERAR